MRHRQAEQSASFSAAAESAALGGPATLFLRVRKSLIAPGRVFLLDVEFDAPAGITILFGTSGAGKTTLLECVAGLTQPHEGRIVIGELVLFDSESRVNMPAWRRQIGYLFQNLALFPHLTVEKNIQYGLKQIDRPEPQSRTDSILKTFRIEHLRHRRPGEISGGERQRVALARALVRDPRLLLLDEPLAAMDAATKAHILDDLRSWNEAHRIPILYVTHSREEVFALGERVTVLEGGRVVARGTPHEVINAPRQESVAQLVGFENIFDAGVFSAHEDRGTMTCRLAGSTVELETPLLRAGIGSSLRVGIRAGDILLANEQPRGLSARNILQGKLLSMTQHDVIVTAKVDCGVMMQVHLTLAARDSLQLAPDREVWLVIKTHSCHLMTR
jgi:molybdate transport system ATP-binding protein